MQNYTSSIIIKYGDIDNSRQDFKTVREIYSRQGMDFFIDFLANHIGELSLELKLSSSEISRLKKSILDDLGEAINERT